MSSAKEDILRRIRRAVPGAGGNRRAEYQAIARGYQQPGTLDEEARLDLFMDRLYDYGASVYRCGNSGIREAVLQVLIAREKRSMVVSRDLPQDWLPDNYLFIRDRGLSYHEIDKSEGVLTGCALAIASTGTIILYHSGRDGRRALSLIPDYHLCVVNSNQVVETVPEGLRAMERFSAFPLTTISGPSATSDIEMTRINGVHGPRTLDVILVTS